MGPLASSENLVLDPLHGLHDPHRYRLGDSIVLQQPVNW